MSLSSNFLGINWWNYLGHFYLHQEKTKIEVHQSMAVFSQVTTTTWCVQGGKDVHALKDITMVTVVSELWALAAMVF